MPPPQSFTSSYAPRLRIYGNALHTPVIQPAAQLPASRTTKRGTTIINYAEDGFEDDDFESSEGPRRPTGLRSLRREDNPQAKAEQAEKLGKQLKGPVDVQPIFRDWMVRHKHVVE